MVSMIDIPTRESISKDLLDYVISEFTEGEEGKISGETTVSELFKLSRVVRSCGRNFVLLGVAGFIESRYGLPINDVNSYFNSLAQKSENFSLDNVRIIDAVELIYNHVNGRGKK